MLGNIKKYLSPSSRLKTDVTFVLRSGTFPAHKIFLSVSLPVLYELFYGENADRTLEKVNLEFASLSSFTIFMNHVYGSEMEVDSLSFRTLVELNWLAVKYDDETFSNVLIPKMEVMKEKQNDGLILKLWEELGSKFAVLLDSLDNGKESESSGGSTDCFGNEITEDQNLRRIEISKDIRRIIKELEIIEDIGSLDEDIVQAFACLGLESGVRDVEISEEDGSLECNSTGWRSAIIPDVKEFRVLCSYVGYDGNLSVSSFEQVRTRKLIDSYLDSMYSGSEPSPSDKDWVVGERCVAKFNDEKWYRANVISFDVSSPLVKVVFVDYGNEEFCSGENLRRNVFCTSDIPIQSLTIEMKGVKDEKTIVLSDELVTKLHNYLIEKELYVRLDKESKCLPLVGSVGMVQDIGKMFND